MAGRLDIRPVSDTERLRVWFHAGRSQRLVLCFSGVGPDRRHLPEIEFAKTASHGGRDHVVYLADPQRSWLNEPGQIEEMVGWAEKFLAETGAVEVVTLGHSMGGFNAMAFPAYMKIDAVLATGPQFSVHPEVAHDERRWRFYRSKIASYRIRELSGLLRDGPYYIVLHGDHRREAPQRERFPLRDNLHHYYIRGVNHDVPQLLREKGILQDVLEAAFQKKPKRVRLLMQRAGIPAYRRKDAPAGIRRQIPTEGG